MRFNYFDKVSFLFLFLIPFLFLASYEIIFPVMESAISYWKFIGFLALSLLIKVLYELSVTWGRSKNTLYFLLAIPSITVAIYCFYLSILFSDTFSEVNISKYTDESFNSSSDRALFEMNRELQEENSMMKSEFSLANSFQSIEAKKSSELFFPVAASTLSLSEQYKIFLKNNLEQLTTKNNEATENELLLNHAGMELYMYAETGDWQGFSNSIDSLSTEFENADSFAANLLLILGAPTEVILQYVERGGKVAPTSLLGVLKEEKYELLDRFENYGQDVFTSKPGTLNLFELALMSELSKSAFDYAISKSKNIDLINNMTGTDLLGLLLVNAGSHDEHLEYFANVLLQEGSRVSEQHHKILSKIKVESPDVYNELAGIVIAQ